MRHDECRGHALPLDDRLFREPLYVTHAGWEHVRPHQTYPRPGHPSYYGFTWAEGRVLGEFCLCLVTQGKGELQTRQGLQPIQAGQAFLYKPGEWHRHRPDPAIGWSNVWIDFNGDLAHDWMRSGAFRLNKNRVEIENLPLFKSQFRRLVEEIDASGTRNSLQFSWQTIGLVSHFLVDAAPAAQAKTASSGDPLVDAAMDYIWSQSHNRIGVPDVALHAGVNRRSLERRFRAGTGTTLLDEIHRCRLARAALLLTETDAPVKYVIGRAGFASYQRLRLAFQKHFHLSPESYRQHHQRARAQVKIRKDTLTN